MCWLIISFFCGVFMTVFGFAKDNPTLGYVGVVFLVVLVITIGTMVCSFVKMDSTAKDMVRQCRQKLTDLLPRIQETYAGVLGAIENIKDVKKL